MISKKFTVQIKATVIIEKEIKADSMDDALDEAKRLAMTNDNSTAFMRGRDGWYISSSDSEVCGVLS